MRKVKKAHFSPGDRFRSLFEEKTISFKSILFYTAISAKKVVSDSPMCVIN